MMSTDLVYNKFRAMSEHNEDQQGKRVTLCYFSKHGSWYDVVVGGWYLGRRYACLWKLCSGELIRDLELQG